MPLIRRVPWTVQPQSGLLLGAGHPSAAGLVSMVSPAVSPLDLAYGSPLTFTGARKVSPTAKGLGANTTGTPDFFESSRAGGATFSKGVSALWIGRVDVLPTGPTATLISKRSAYSGTGIPFTLSYDNAGQLYWFVIGSGGAANISVPLTAGQLVAFAGTWDGATQRIYKDGVEIHTRAETGTITNNSTNISYGALPDASERLTGSHVFAAVWSRGLSAGEIRSLTDNPWQLFEPRRIIIPVSAGAGGGSVDLAGNAAASATASAALDLLKALQGDAQGQASATGNLSTSGTVDLQGNAAAQAAATGALSLQVPLSGAALAQASASGSFTHLVPLAGAAAAQATGAGALSLSIALSGAALGQAAASGSLLGTVDLSGQAAALGVAVGTLSLSVPLSGAAQALAAASGGLLVISATLNGAAIATAQASGSLQIAVLLSGAAGGQAQAAGVLTVPGTDEPAAPTRIYAPRLEARVFVAAFEARIHTPNI
jgi:hypothetical protein